MDLSDINFEHLTEEDDDLGCEFDSEDESEDDLPAAEHMAALRRISLTRGGLCVTVFYIYTFSYIHIQFKCNTSFCSARFFNHNFS